MRSQILCHTLFAFRFPPFFPLSFLFFFFALFLVFFFFSFFSKKTQTPIFFPLCVHISFNILVVVHLAMKIDAFTVYDALFSSSSDDEDMERVVLGDSFRFIIISLCFECVNCKENVSSFSSKKRQFFFFDEKETQIKQIIGI